MVFYESKTFMIRQNSLCELGELDAVLWNSSANLQQITVHEQSVLQTITKSLIDVLKIRRLVSTDTIRILNNKIELKRNKIT